MERSRPDHWSSGGRNIDVVRGSIEFSASCISEGAPSWLHHPSIITEQEASMHHAITTELAAMMMDQSISTSTDSNSDALNDSGSLMNSGAS
jgi:hypothetical protein